MTEKIYKCALQKKVPKFGQDYNPTKILDGCSSTIENFLVRMFVFLFWLDNTISKNLTKNTFKKSKLKICFK